MKSKLIGFEGKLKGTTATIKILGSCSKSADEQNEKLQVLAQGINDFLNELKVRYSILNYGSVLSEKELRYNIRKIQQQLPFHTRVASDNGPSDVKVTNMIK
jgi:hypothetical protein